MIVELDDKLRDRLQRLVETGQFSSVEEGVNAAVADLVALAEDDLAWARPYVDAARASAARGDVVDGDTVIGELDKRAGH